MVYKYEASGVALNMFKEIVGHNLDVWCEQGALVPLPRVLRV